DETHVAHALLAGAGAPPVLDVGEGAFPADGVDGEGIGGDGQVQPERGGPSPREETAQGHIDDEGEVEDHRCFADHLVEHRRVSSMGRMFGWDFLFPVSQPLPARAKVSYSWRAAWRRARGTPLR